MYVFHFGWDVVSNPMIPVLDSVAHDHQSPRLHHHQHIPASDNPVALSWATLRSFYAWHTARSAQLVVPGGCRFLSLLHYGSTELFNRGWLGVIDRSIALTCKHLVHDVGPHHGRNCFPGVCSHRVSLGTGVESAHDLALSFAVRSRWEPLSECLAPRT